MGPSAKTSTSGDDDRLGSIEDVICRNVDEDEIMFSG